MTPQTRSSRKLYPSHHTKEQLTPTKAGSSTTNGRNIFFLMMNMMKWKGAIPAFLAMPLLSSGIFPIWRYLSKRVIIKLLAQAMTIISMFTGIMHTKAIMGRVSVCWTFRVFPRTLLGQEFLNLVGLTFTLKVSLHALFLINILPTRVDNVFYESVKKLVLTSCRRQLHGRWFAGIRWQLVFLRQLSLRIHPH